MREAQITSLINRQTNQMMEVEINTTEHMVLWYKTEETYVTRKKTVLHARVIRTIRAEAVSYTHLDVYKRQVLYYACCLHVTFKSLSSYTGSKFVLF